MNIANVLEVGWVDVLVIALVVYIIYRMVVKRGEARRPAPPPRLPPMKKRDFTVKQLMEYNGVDNERILMAVCEKVFDVTSGKAYYGPQGTYGKLAGRDATRALAAWDVDRVSEEYDDHSDMTASEMDDARGWAEQLAYKYPLVGRLIKDDDEPMDYGGEDASV